MHPPREAWSLDPFREKGGLIVARASAPCGGKASSTSIVKYVDPSAANDPAGYETAAERLARETATYRFLTAKRDRFSAFPRLLEANPGFLALEELKGDDFAFKDELEAQTALAETFAELHVATSGCAEAYLSCLNAVGLDDQFRQLDQHLTAGQDLIRDDAAEHGLSADTFDRDLEKSDHLLAAPNPFRCLVHGDFHSPSQAVLISGRFYLLDFASAEYAHGMLDLVRFPLGHVVYDHEKNVWHRFALKTVEGFTSFYRSRFEASLGRSLDDSLWSLHYGAAMLISAVDLIGNLLEQPDRVRDHGLSLEPARPFLPDYLEILELAAESLKDVDEFSNTYALFHQLRKRRGF